MKQISPLWINRKDMPPEIILRVYEECERGVATRCINTRYNKACAKLQGRIIRKLNTLKGYMNWSELIDGEWHMYCQRLQLKYAKKIDAFDNENKHFRLPVSCPMESVEHKGPCIERKDPIDVIRARKALYNDRVKKGLIVPRSKFRDPQAPSLIKKN